MSLFDQVVNDGSFDEPPLGPPEGFAGTLLCASACDGHIAEEEMRTLTHILQRMDLFAEFAPHQFEGMVDRLLGILKRNGPEGLLGMCAPLIPSDLLQTAFVNAVDIVLSDGVVEPEEKTFIDALAQRLSMDEEEALTIIRVMVLKYRG